jgi:hypothetical protein
MRFRNAAFVLTILLLPLLSARASAQEISPDGRSIVGRTTLLDRLVQFLDPDKLLIGLDSDELLRYGEALYPEEGHQFNRAGHRLGARILTRRYGVVVATALGVLNEVFEAHNLRDLGMPYFSEPRFDFGDIGANLRGTFDAYAEDLNTPWGPWRMIRRLSGCSTPGFREAPGRSLPLRLAGGAGAAPAANGPPGRPPAGGAG